MCLRLYPCSRTPVKEFLLFSHHSGRAERRARQRRRGDGVDGLQLYVHQERVEPLPTVSNVFLLISIACSDPASNLQLLEG